MTKVNLHRVSTAPQLSAPSGAIVSAYLAHGVRFQSLGMTDVASNMEFTEYDADELYIR